MWGAFNPDLEKNGVRLFEIHPTIRILQPEEIDARVEVTDMESGVTEVWRDSVVQLDDGDFRHVYWSASPIEYNHSYEVKAVRSDGESVRALVTVPDSLRIAVQEADQGQVTDIFVPIDIIGTPPSVTRVTVTYTIFGWNEFTADATTESVEIDYTNTQEPNATGFEIPIELRKDYRAILSFLASEGFAATLVELRNMRIDVHIGNEGWISPSGSFDPNILVEPGLLSNVENGFGFVGAGFIRTIEWLPADALVNRAGFGFVGAGAGYR